MHKITDLAAVLVEAAASREEVDTQALAAEVDIRNPDLNREMQTTWVTAAGPRTSLNTDSTTLSTSKEDMAEDKRREEATLMANRGPTVNRGMPS